MSMKVHARTRARASALAVLYSSDITEVYADKLIDEGAYPSEDFEFSEYAEDLVRGVSAHIVEIDKHLAATSENWAVDRMPVVDRAILRLAVYEMIYVDDVPVSVTINEAVELAKQYGGEDESPRFINGVLGRIARMLEGESAEELADEPAGEPFEESCEEAGASEKAEEGGVCDE